MLLTEDNRAGLIPAMIQQLHGWFAEPAQPTYLAAAPCSR